MVTVCAIGAKLIHIEDIVGAFLCGVAISQVLGEGPAREKLELLGKQFFIRLLWSVVIVGVLSLIGGVIISQRMLRRVDELARTANTIIQGDLGTRLPVQGIGDEFDRVAQNVNRMLDQIERLTSGMRTVIDSVVHCGVR